jgi:hypothetical protein
MGGSLFLELLSDWICFSYIFFCSDMEGPSSLDLSLVALPKIKFSSSNC